MNIQNTYDLSTSVTESWLGGYKLTTDLAAKSSVRDWQLEFFLPQGDNLRAVYGAEFTDLGNGHYSIQGKNSQDLTSKQSKEIILIVDGNGNEPTTPEYELPDFLDISNTKEASSDENSKSSSIPTTVSDDSVESEVISDPTENFDMNVSH